MDVLVVIVLVVVEAAAAAAQHTCEIFRTFMTHSGPFLHLILTSQKEYL